jgi:hypothetical protein
MQEPTSQDNPGAVRMFRALRLIVSKDDVTKRTLISSGYEAEFFIDRKGETVLYHYIITRKGNADILMWGQEPSMEEAERAAMDWMSIYGLKSVSAAG